VGEILGWIGLVLVMSACGAGGVLYFSRFFRHSDPLALRGDPEAVRTAYTMARSAVRLLEHLVERDNLVPFLSTEERKDIDALIGRFNDL
jgi:hypothetical protein